MVLIALLDSSGTTSAQIMKCDKSRNILDEAQVQYEVVDGMDPAAADARNLLFKLSRQFANYPLFFYEFGYDGEIKFLGSYEDLQILYHHNKIPNEGNANIVERENMITFQESIDFLADYKKKAARQKQTRAQSPSRRSRMVDDAEPSNHNEVAEECDEIIVGGTREKTPQHPNNSSTTSSYELCTMSPTKSRIKKKVGQLDSSRKAQFDTGIIPYDLSPTKQRPQSPSRSTPWISPSKLSAMYSSPTKASAPVYSHRSGFSPQKSKPTSNTILPMVPSLGSSTVATTSNNSMVSPVKQKSIKASLSSSFNSPSKKLYLKSGSGLSKISAADDYENSPTGASVKKKKEGSPRINKLRPSVIRGASFDEDENNSPGPIPTKYDKSNDTIRTRIDHVVPTLIDVDNDDNNEDEIGNNDTFETVQKKSVNRSLRPGVVRGTSFEDYEFRNQPDNSVRNSSHNKVETEHNDNSSLRNGKSNRDSDNGSCLEDNENETEIVHSEMIDEDPRRNNGSQMENGENRTTRGNSLRPGMVRGLSFDNDNAYEKQLSDAKNKEISDRKKSNVKRGQKGYEDESEGYTSSSSISDLRPRKVRGDSLDNDDFSNNNETPNEAKITEASNDNEIQSNQIESHDTPNPTADDDDDNNTNNTSDSEEAFWTSMSRATVVRGRSYDQLEGINASSQNNRLQQQQTEQNETPKLEENIQTPIPAEVSNTQHQGEEQDNPRPTPKKEEDEEEADDSTSSCCTSDSSTVSTRSDPGFANRIYTQNSRKATTKKAQGPNAKSSRKGKLVRRKKVTDSNPNVSTDTGTAFEEKNKTLDTNDEIAQHYQKDKFGSAAGIKPDEPIYNEGSCLRNDETDNLHSASGHQIAMSNNDKTDVDESKQSVDSDEMDTRNEPTKPIDNKNDDGSDSSDSEAFWTSFRPKMQRGLSFEENDIIAKQLIARRAFECDTNSTTDTIHVRNGENNAQVHDNSHTADKRKITGILDELSLKEKIGSTSGKVQRRNSTGSTDDIPKEKSKKEKGKLGKKKSKRTKKDKTKEDDENGDVDGAKAVPSDRRRKKRQSKVESKDNDEVAPPCTLGNFLVFTPRNYEDGTVVSEMTF